MRSDHEPIWVLNEANGKNYCGHCGLSETAHAVFYEDVDTVEDDYEDDRR